MNFKGMGAKLLRWLGSRKTGPTYDAQLLERMDPQILMDTFGKDIPLPSGKVYFKRFEAPHDLR